MNSIKIPPKFGGISNRGCLFSNLRLRYHMVLPLTMIAKIVSWFTIVKQHYLQLLLLCLPFLGDIGCKLLIKI